LRATGGAAGYTKQQLDAMADSMADSTMFDDEAIRDAQSTLLKFGDIQGDVFARGMKLAADYASFTGGEMEDAAQTIGKALQSPEEGVGALARQIGKLTYTQKESIKGFMEQGRVMDAQNVILDILQKKIGGTSDLMNTGLTKSLKDINKNWGEFSETVGRSAPATTVLNGINNALKNMKNTIESGDWMEALKYAISPYKILTQQKAAPKSEAVSGFIGGGPADPRLTARLAEINNQIEAARKKQSEQKTGRAKQEMSLDELLTKGAQKRLEVQEQAQMDAEKAAADLRKEQERLRESVIDLIDPTAQYSRQIDVYRKAMDDGIITVEQYIEVATVLQGRINETRERHQELNEEAKKTDNVARDLGLTFSSAFEDAIVEGKALREVIKGLGMDLARIAVRKTMTEPLGAAFSGLVKSGVDRLFAPKPWVGAGDMDLPTMAGGGFTGSGSRAGGLDGQGGFLSILHPQETVIDHARGGSSGGSVTVVQHINIDSRSDRSSILQAMAAAKDQAKSEILASMQRGGTFARA
jgi:pyridoxine 5'-phosphate synthase PdxJ